MTISQRSWLVIGFGYWLLVIDMLDLAIEKQQGDFKLVVAFQVGAEIMVLFGPSGAGKSLTLQCIAGLATPDRGFIRLDGVTLFESDGAHVRRNVPIRQRQVGYVFQDYALFPHMTVRQNVAYPARHPRGAGSELHTSGPTGVWGAQLPTVVRQVEVMLERMHLAGLGDRYPDQLSGGQQQRVAIARALMARPRLLLLDEPFSALGMGVRERLQNDLVKVQRELGLPVVYVTHQLAHAFAVGTRLAVIENGRLAQIGTMQEVFHHPNNRAVAQITGVKNILEGQVLEATAKALWVDWCGTALQAPPQPHRPGEPVTLYIRPEDVKVLYPDRPLAAAVRHNVIRGRVVRMVPQGATCALVIEVEVGGKRGELEARFPSRAYQELGLEAGREVTISLRREALILLPESKRTTT